MNRIKTIATLALLLCATMALAGNKEGLIEFVGSQKNIFTTGKAEGVMPLSSMSAIKKGLYAVGPVEGLDGEITIFDSKPYITRVSGTGYTLDNSLNYGAIFLVWIEQDKWQDITVPATIKGYVELQQFIKAQAEAKGIDVTKPFAFLLAGTPPEVKWHINVDRTEGNPITKELFAKSKEGYVLKGEPVDIIGFYSETHPGVFITEYIPPIKPDSGLKNYLHMHLVSRASKAAGHIDDMTLGPDTVLRLPKP